MNRKKVIWLSAIVVSLSSCDTRDDFFLEHGEAPIIEMSTANDTMNSEFWDGKKYRVIEVCEGKPDTLNYSFTDPYGKECTVDFKLTSIPEENYANNVLAEDLVYYFGAEVCKPEFSVKSLAQEVIGIIDNSKMPLDNYKEYATSSLKPYLNIKKMDGKVIFELEPGNPSEYKSRALDYALETSRLASKGYTSFDKTEDEVRSSQFYSYFGKEIPLSKKISARYTLTVTNKIGVKTEEYVLVKIKPNSQPVPNITATCVDKETNEYKISVNATDPDGHKIVKYSYVFDYKPYNMARKRKTGEGENIKYEPFATYFYYPGFLYYDTYVYTNGAISDYSSKDSPEGSFYLFTFGVSNYLLKLWNVEADYILPTSRKEVFHIFQTKGEHSIYVRCQDEFGLWSDYKEEKIYIE